MKITAVWAFSFLLSTFCCDHIVSAVSVKSIVPLGLFDVEHTGNDGITIGSAYDLNEAGHVTGFSGRFKDGGGSLGRSAWLYNGMTINIGLTGSEHTSDEGHKYSEPTGLNEAGEVTGYSRRYNGGSDWGFSVWLYDGTQTIDIGLTDFEHTRSDGYKSSTADYTDKLNEAGQVSGHSQRFNGGSTDLGLSAWLYDGTHTIDISLIDNEHTRNDGYRISGAAQLNEAGQIRGTSFRYNGGSTYLGRDAWLYHGATMVEIGLNDNEYTRNDGYQYIQSKRLNEAGKVMGISNRYNGGSTFLGRSAWLYDGVTTFGIALANDEHTGVNGYKFAEVVELNEAGQVSGYSDRYSGSVDMGRSAWLYNGTTTIDIGLTGGEHTRNDGYKYSTAVKLSATGRVSGYSNRYEGGGDDLGQSAWLFDGSMTTEIGLDGNEYTRDDGYKYSTVNQQFQPNEAGQVVGFSRRFNGGHNELGQSAWLSNGTTTTKIGLIDAVHTRDDGYIFNYVDALNEAGQVIGTAERYNGGGTWLGHDAWFYDPVLDETIPLTLPTPNDGFSISSVSYFGEDGLTLGQYQLYDDLGNDLGGRAFYFTPADGFHDLGALVDGALVENQWEYLASADRINGQGQILGAGKLIGALHGAIYLLTPEPSVAGDYNQNGIVDAGDYAVWRDHLGQIFALPNEGPETTPGQVTMDDYDFWKAHFGQSIGSGAATRVNRTVPEPQTLLMFVASALTICYRGTRKYQIVVCPWRTSRIDRF